jgi:hypothetical protein
MLEKICPFKYIPMMLTKKRHNFRKNRNVVSCRLMKVRIIVGLKKIQRII